MALVPRLSLKPSVTTLIQATLRNGLYLFNCPYLDCSATQCTTQLAVEKNFLLACSECFRWINPRSIQH